MHIEHVGAYEAKTHLPALLESVSHGKKFVITRKGIPIALLVPYHEEKQSIDKTIEALKTFRQTLRLDELSIRNMREDGRRR